MSAPGMFENVIESFGNKEYKERDKKLEYLRQQYTHPLDVVKKMFQAWINTSNNEENEHGKIKESCKLLQFKIEDGLFDKEDLEEEEDFDEVEFKKNYQEFLLKHEDKLKRSMEICTHSEILSEKVKSCRTWINAALNEENEHGKIKESCKLLQFKIEDGLYDKEDLEEEEDFDEVEFKKNYQEFLLKHEDKLKRSMEICTHSEILSEKVKSCRTWINAALNEENGHDNTEEMWKQWLLEVQEFLAEEDLEEEEDIDEVEYKKNYREFLLEHKDKLTRSMEICTHSESLSEIVKTCLMRINSALNEIS